MTTSNTSSGTSDAKITAGTPALIPGLPQPPPNENILQVEPDSRKSGQEMEWQLVKLHCFEGRPLRECAKLMGMNYYTVHAVWRTSVENHRRSVKAFIDEGYRGILQLSMPLASKSAAHRALVIKVKDSLRKLHGVSTPEANGTRSVASLDEIGARVRVNLSRLDGEIERMRALRRSTADAPP